jgi:3-phosphoshikimate 1-carboxyvinyltransferase
VIIEGDWSSAAILLAAGAIGGRSLRLSGLAPDSDQPDRRVLSLLADMGVEAVWEGVTLRCSGGPRRALEADLDATPDLFPPLAALAATLEEPSTFHGLARLRDKESDRLTAMADGLRRLGAAVESGTDWMRVARGQLRAARVDGASDHRVVMSLAALSLAAGEVSVDRPEAVAKSFPGFWTALAGIRSAS